MKIGDNTAMVGIRPHRPFGVGLSDRFWPLLLTPADARAAAMQGVWAALILSAITVLFIVFGNGMLGIDAWSFVDVALVLFFAFGTWRMWRWAAIAGLLLFVIGKVTLFAENPDKIKGFSLFLSFIFLMMYVNGVRGTFAYRALTRRLPPSPVAAPAPN